jgi:hypothetical protein
MDAGGVRQLAARRNARSVRRSRVVLAPRPWRLSMQACASMATVTKNAAHRGEHEVSRKAIARGRPGCLGCTCQTRVRCFLFARGAAGAVSARLSLRPLRFRGTTRSHHSGEFASRECRRSSFRGAPLGASPESITTGRSLSENRRPIFEPIIACGYGFRALASLAPE